MPHVEIPQAELKVSFAQISIVIVKKENDIAAAAYCELEELQLLVNKTVL